MSKVKDKERTAISAERLQFVEPMYARAVQQLPEGDAWMYELKFDGYRCLAGKDSTGVTLWSRRANRSTDQFPTIANACEHLPPNTFLDGEITRRSSLNFPVSSPKLQRSGNDKLYETQNSV